ncbi:MAG: hypothetical protein NTX33_00035 [Propionibacteriales bacterium]|nr:hypothetical protein [Propionibacteriales bacterium]
MRDGTPSFTVEIGGDYAEFLAAEMERQQLSAAEVVQRSLGLYCLIGEAIENGEQLVVQRLIDDVDLPPLLRIDYYVAPQANADLSTKIEIPPDNRRRAELMSWPSLY